MDKIILTSQTKNSLVHDLANEVSDRLKHLLADYLSKLEIDDEYLTRKDVAKMFKISLVTVHEWSKKGILKPHKIGTRVRFKKTEVMAAIKEMETEIG